jgi:hypothetical protein
MSSPYDEIRDVVETAMARGLTLDDLRDIVDDVWESAIERKRAERERQREGFYDHE